MRDVGRRYTCIESRRGGGGGRSCNMVAIVIDGVSIYMKDAQAVLIFVSSLNLHHFESMEYLSPVDAGTRYGLDASARGALVLWHRGMGPYRSEARGGGG